MVAGSVGLAFLRAALRLNWICCWTWLVKSADERRPDQLNITTLIILMLTIIYSLCMNFWNVESE